MRFGFAIISALTLALTASASAHAYQYIQCASEAPVGGVSFVLALGYQGGNTLFVASPTIYPGTEESDVMAITREDAEANRVKWSGSDGLFAYEVSYAREFDGKPSFQVPIKMTVVNVKDAEDKLAVSAHCFSVIRAD